MMILYNKVHLKPNPRKHILTNLSELIDKQHKERVAVILIMDANEDWEKIADGYL